MLCFSPLSIITMHPTPPKICAIFLHTILTCQSRMQIESLVAPVTRRESVLLLLGPNRIPQETTSLQRAEQNTPSRLITAQTPAVSQSPNLLKYLQRSSVVFI